MNETYYEPRDLEDFPNIGEYASEPGAKFFEYYTAATSAGKLSEREKALIALAVATVRHCPYCIDAYTMLDLTVNSGAPVHIKDFDYHRLVEREIVVLSHCFACTAGAGSSCQGELAT